jgi:hypothetical protein
MRQNPMSYDATVDERLDLLTTIGRCPVVEACLTQVAPTHPCSEIVLHQWVDVPVEERIERWRAEHHVPEPWAGHVERASLLFLSSNPSLTSRRRPGPPPKKQASLGSFNGYTREDHPALRHGLSAPTWEWTDDELDDRYSSAFDVWMNPGGTANLDASGSSMKSVPYWRAIKKLADHLYGRSARPGSDYALTEAVHCKSPAEIGVPAAASVCASLYLQRALTVSPATVLVVVGRVARQEFRRMYDYPDAPQISRPISIGGRERIVVFVAGPNAQRSKYPKTVLDRDVGVIRRRLESRFSD